MKLRITALIIESLTFLTLICSCGDKPASYRNDIPVADLKAAAEAKLSNTDTFVELDSDYIEYMMELDSSAFTEGIVRWQASGISADEYGIFKASTEEDAAALAELLKNYLKKRDETWNPSYDADQYPKIQNAEVKIMGQYAVFCILSDSDRAAVFTAVENALLGK